VAFADHSGPPNVPKQQTRRRGASPNVAPDAQNDGAFFQPEKLRSQNVDKGKTTTKKIKTHRVSSPEFPPRPRNPGLSGADLDFPDR